MKSVLITAALLAAAGGPSFAKTVRIPVTRGAGGVPVPCGEDPLRTCHNRWHPDIPEVAEADPGDTVIFETRDAFDNPFNRRSTRATVAAANLNLIHPLTGPLHVRGAKRGDVLAVTMIDVGPGPDNFGYTVAVPGFGFLRDVFTDPAIVHWELGPLESNGNTRFDVEGPPGRAAAAAWVCGHHRRRAGPARDRDRLRPRGGTSGEAMAH